ncbi:MAG: shikimate dehydrogenase [Oscillospiraceae bacterium]|nr:shikimate dehydrogenase [Oscillospiraceae bacterium]
MQYGLIGEHLTHSYSCELHGKIADYDYELFELAPDELERFMAERSFLGINVTIPYKQAVIPFLDELSDTARRIGAVNTIVNRDGRLFGYNTDYAGMRAMLRFAGIDVTGRKVLILGTGGTSKTAHAVAESLGASEILHVSRRAAPGAVTYAEAESDHRDARIIINTTPVGMYPASDDAPIDISHFPALEGIADAVYNPLRTRLVTDGLERGIPSSGGLYMLSAQAVYASALFTGTEADSGLIYEAFRATELEKQNIALIGMPSSGKTTVGKHLAEITGKGFYDTDEIIVGRIGMTISEYFALNGEEAFRRLESEVIAEIARQSGCVIATGGGAVLDHENVRALKRNGTVVFLDRAPDELCATSDRPLSSSREALMRLYAERLPIYRAAADITLLADTDPKTEAGAIWREITK